LLIRSVSRPDNRCSGAIGGRRDLYGVINWRRSDNAVGAIKAFGKVFAPSLIGVRDSLRLLLARKSRRRGENEKSQQGLTNNAPSRKRCGAKSVPENLRVRFATLINLQLKVMLRRSHIEDLAQEKCFNQKSDARGVTPRACTDFCD
jgi:hypothetical protein